MTVNPSRHMYTVDEVLVMYERPLFELLHEAQTVHRQNFDPLTVQLSTLISIKTGTCPEDCAYCPQSGHYKAGVTKMPLMALEEALNQARKAKEAGATRFCMGAAWRSPNAKQLEMTAEIVKAVKAEGLETCVTLGMLTADQAKALKEAGLDYYNHNLDTSPEYYSEIITTRTYQDRLDTLEHVRQAGLNTCCGGIIGMGEGRADRAGLLVQLANLPEPPQSVPINHLAPVKGTPLENTPPLDVFEFVKTIAVARLLMPRSMVRLSAGRDKMSDEMQAMCFYAGANSIFYGEEKLFITANPLLDNDLLLLKRLGMKALTLEEVQAGHLPVDSTVCASERID